MSAITIENDLVHYEVLGRGRPVILVHGWLSSWRYWITTMQQLSMKYRTYALDLWGYGDSSKDTQRLGLDAQVKLVDDFIEKLGIGKKVAMVGHALGAAVAIRYALQKPERVARLMTISAPLFEHQGGSAPAPARPTPAEAAAPTILKRPEAGDASTAPGDSAKPAQDAAEAPETTVTRSLWSHDSPTILRRPPLDIPLTGRPSPAPEVRLPSAAALPSVPAPDARPNPLLERLTNVEPRQLLEKHLPKDTPDFDKLMTEVSKTSARALSVSAASFDGVDLAEDVRRLISPTLLVHGEKDAFMPPPSENLINYLSYGKDNFRCVVWPEVNHFPMLSEPAAFQRLVMDFLEIADVDELELKERWVRKVR